MVNYIGEVSILCMKIGYMLLCTTDIGNAYKCCLYAGTWLVLPRFGPEPKFKPELS